MPRTPPFGARKSPIDIRTFTAPTKAYASQQGGKRYDPQDIEDQSKVGICTAIHLTQNARKATGIKYSAEFQYLLQKKYIDKDWDEGSSIFAALKVAKTYGLLPADQWTHTTQADRGLPYEKYIAKLKAIPQAEIDRLLAIAASYKIKAYASVPVNRDAMAAAIDASEAGILVRFDVGSEWYTSTAGVITWDKSAIEPLRKPSSVISGHAIIESNYDGYSFRVANTWGVEWCEDGTAYHVLTKYAPTECWAVYYNDTPAEIDAQLQQREQLLGRVKDLLQQIVAILIKQRSSLAPFLPSL
jgi:hypothetical protein